MKIKITFVAFSLLFSCSTFSNTLQDAEFFYEDENYPKAFELYKDLASIGCKGAQYSLVNMYINGEGVDKSLAHAYAWSTLLGLAGDEASLEIRSDVETKLKGMQLARANEIYLELNQQYGPQAIGKRYFFSSTEPGVDFVPARFIATAFSRSSIRLLPLEKAEEFALVSFDVDEKGITRNHRVEYSSDRNRKKAAIRIVGQSRYTPSTLNNKPIASYRLSTTIGFNRNNEYFIANDENLIATTYRKILEDLTGKEVKEESFVSEEFALFTLENRKSTSVLSGSPIAWLTSAASCGEALAQREIGLLHLHGAGSTYNADKAIFWLTRASENGDDVATYVLGRYLLDRSQLSGIKFLKAASKSLDEANLALAWHYATSAPKASDNNRSVDLAKFYFSKVKKHLFNDHHTYYQVRAAVESATGNFKSAKKSIKKAIKIAKASDFYLEDLEQYEKIIHSKNRIVVNP